MSMSEPTDRWALRAAGPFAEASTGAGPDGTHVPAREALDRRHGEPVPTLGPGIPANVEASHDPAVPTAAFPDDSGSTSLTWLVNSPIFRAHALLPRDGAQIVILTNSGQL